MQLIERGFVRVSCTGVPQAGEWSYLRTRHIAGVKKTSAAARSRVRDSQQSST
jgi:hypothetical protein